MHIISKRSHLCYTMHVFISSNAAKKAPLLACKAQGSFLCVCAIANKWMECCDRQRGVGKMSCRRKIINPTGREERQWTSPNQRRQKGRGRRVNSRLTSPTTQCTDSAEFAVLLQWSLQGTLLRQSQDFKVNFSTK